MPDQGTSLKRMLSVRRLSVTDLARQVDADRDHVGRIANGLRRPSRELATKIAVTLEVAVADLFPQPAESDVVEQRIRDLLDAAPPLSVEQRARLATLLTGTVNAR